MVGSELNSAEITDPHPSQITPPDSSVVTIVSIAMGLGFGLGATSGALAGMPERLQLIFGGSGIVPAAILAIILNIVIPREQEDIDNEAKVNCGVE